MGSEQYRSPCKIICVLCKKSDENNITGPLSSKEDISAHENCLLFSSGIYCKNSPTYDDLFGFAVEDVKEELRRGKRLLCHHCKRNGATAGCDVKRCKCTYHYPCAIEASARAIEDSTVGMFKLLCKRHDPESKGARSESLQLASTSGLNGSKRQRSADSHGRRPDRSGSYSSTGSSDASVSRKKNFKLLDFLESDDDIDHGFAPVESDVEECAPPKQHNQSTPYPERKRPTVELNPSATGSLNGGLMSDQKACGSTDNPGELNVRSTSNSPACSPEVEMPRRKKTKYLKYSDDESPTCIDPAVAPDLDESVLPKQPISSTPVPGNARRCEKLNPSTTGADDDDTDVDLDSEESQSLLSTKMYHITVPCNVIVDLGPSAESEYSLELGSPVRADPEATPASVAAEHEEKPSTSRTSPRPTVDVPMMVTSAVQTLPTSNLKLKQLPERSPPAGVSPSPDQAAASDAWDVNSTGISQSSASIFWTRCNQAGWTEEIFSELASQLSSLGERVQSQEASHQDYDVALKILEASGSLPCIITQLEQDLEKQEQDLQRKKAALRDARSVLGV